MKLKIRAFSGMRPVMAQDLLRPGEAVLAVNTHLKGGDLEPISALSATVITLTSASAVRALYKYGQTNANENEFWFQSINEANFVKGPIDGDTEERTYFTGVLSSPPGKTKADIATTAPPYPANFYRMGLPVPTTPSVAITGTATVPADPAITYAYCVTLVSAWGEEGPPSIPFLAAGWRAGQTITVTSQTAQAGSYAPITGKRVYRSSTGAGGTARFLLVNTEGDVALATAAYVDGKNSLQLGEALATRGWSEPSDAMVGLTQMANGMLAGFFQSTVCFSEPFFPYAWPVRYQQSVDAPVIGMAAFDQTLLVATSRSLYIMTGSDPTNITSEKLALAQTCLSRRSMVEMMGGVVFACPDGLAYIGSSGFKMLTDGLMTRREWQAYAPSSMHAYEVDGRYLCFFDTGARKAGLIFSFGDDSSFCETDIHATAGFRDRSTDKLFLCGVGSGSARPVTKWDVGGGSPATFTWTSGVLRLDSPANLSVARVSATGSVNFTLLADGAVVFGPVAVASSVAFKLPSGYRSARYQVTLSGTSVVRSVELADSMQAMAGE